MKKLFSLFLIFLFGCAAVLFVGLQGDDPLNPAAKTPPLSFPEVAPEENAYVGLAGLGRPGDGELAEAGLKHLKGGPQKRRRSDPAIKVSYRNPCLDAEVRNCLDQIEADAAAIDEAVQAHTDFLERYRALRAMPHFVNITADPLSSAPEYNHLIELSRLVGAKALLDIRQGGLEAGLAALEAELDFFKKMAQGQTNSLVDLMIATAGLSIGFLEISAVIGDGRVDLTGQEDRLRRMLELDLDTGPLMAVALKTEKRTLLQLASFSGKSSEAGAPWAAGAAAYDEPSWIEKFAFQFLYKKNMTCNQIAARLDAAIKTLSNRPLLDFPAFAKKEARATKEAAATAGSVKNLYDKYGVFFFKNYVGEMFLDIEHFEYTRYLARLNDAAALHPRLLRAQLELRLIAGQSPDIPAALAELGPETLNPYTGRPFDWDQEKRVLRAERAAQAGDRSVPNWKMEAAVPAARGPAEVVSGGPPDHK